MEPIAETAALLSTMVRALVADRDAVRVSPVSPNPDLILFQVSVAPKEKGKVIGKQGRVARSIRIYLAAVGKENGMSFALNIDGFEDGSTERDTVLKA